MSVTVSRRLLAAAAALALAGSLAGCSSDSNEGSAAPTTAASSMPAPTHSPASASAIPVVCQEIAKARLSLLAVTSVPVVAQGRDAIQAQWETAKADVGAAVESARGEFPDEAQALSDSMAQVQTAVDALQATPSATALAELARAVAKASGAVASLNEALRATC